MYPCHIHSSLYEIEEITVTPVQSFRPIKNKYLFPVTQWTIQEMAVENNLSLFDLVCYYFFDIKSDCITCKKS